MLVPLDAVCAAGVAWLAYRLRFEGQVVPDRFAADYQGATLALAVGWVVAGRAAGLFRRSVLRPGGSSLEAAFGAALASGLALSVTDAAVAHGELSRAWIGLVVLGLVLSAVATRAMVQRLRRALVPFGLGLERYLLVGDDLAGRRLYDDLTRARGAPFAIADVLPTGSTADAVAERALSSRVDGIVLPVGFAAAEAGTLAARLSGAGIDVLLAPGFGQLEMSVASIALLHGVPLLRVAGLSPQRAAEREAPRDRMTHGVALLGTRGIPANYGGFETFAERLALRLVEAQVPTTVYCRRHYATAASPWRGVRLVTLPTIRSKYFDTVVHTALSVAHLVLTRGPRDVVLCNAANAPVLPILRLFRRRVVLNVDGLEWRRAKWGIAGRSWYRLGEWLAVRFASVLVTDADEVRTYYRVRHDTDSVMIPYGADLLERGGLAIPAEVEVAADRYALYVSRWERENNPVMVAAAHARAQCGLDLVMLGQATYDVDIDRQVREAAGSGSHLPGAVYGSAYQALQANAAVYIHATEVGGTHPALIEALGAGNLCLVLDTPENREVVGQAGVYFSDEEGLVTQLQWAGSLTCSDRQAWGERARTHARDRYSWDAVAASYLALFGRNPPGKGPSPIGR